MLSVYNRKIFYSFSTHKSCVHSKAQSVIVTCSRYVIYRAFDTL